MQPFCTLGMVMKGFVQKDYASARRLQPPLRANAQYAGGFRAASS